MIDTNNDEYLKAAREFEIDRESNSEKNRRVAWIIASIAVGVAVACIISIAVMLPLKTIETVVIRVNETTGYADVIQNADDPAAMPKETEHKFWLATYVNAREEYSDAQGFANYRRVGLMSTTEEQLRYFPTMDPDSPKSMLNVFGKVGRVEVKILSISLPDDGVATVRFRKVEKMQGAPRETQWIATISYSYEGLPSDAEDRLLNPRGFMVSEYRIDPESGTMAAGGDR